MKSRMMSWWAAGVLWAGTVGAEVTTWTNMSGQQMEAELMGVQGENVTFRKADGGRYAYPLAQLAEEDRARVEAWVKANPGGGAPARVEVQEPGRISKELAGRLVTVRGSGLVSMPRDAVNGTRYYAVYYSAQWCPPCRTFTPKLVELYTELKAKHPEFEVIFVSSDESPQAMAAYMRDYKMSWPGVRHDQGKRLLPRPGHERGIPNLVFMTAEGEELATSYTTEGRYTGPTRVLGEIRRHFNL